MKKITIIGNVTRDPQRVATKSGAEFVSLSVAVNSTVKGEKVTDYFSVPVSGKAGDAIMNYVHKGSRVAVVGDLVVSTYTSNYGDTKVNLSVSNGQVEFLSGRNDTTESTETKGETMDAFSDVKSDDIPF